MAVVEVAPSPSDTPLVSDSKLTPLPSSSLLDSEKTNLHPRPVHVARRSDVMGSGWTVGGSGLGVPRGGAAGLGRRLGSGRGRVAGSGVASGKYRGAAEVAGSSALGRSFASGVCAASLERGMGSGSGREAGPGVPSGVNPGSTEKVAMESGDSAGSGGHVPGSTGGTAEPGMLPSAAGGLRPDPCLSSQRPSSSSPADPAAKGCCPPSRPSPKVSKARAAGHASNGHLAPPSIIQFGSYVSPNCAASHTPCPEVCRVKDDGLQPRFSPIFVPPRSYGTKEGKPSVSFSDFEFDLGAKRLEHALVAKFTTEDISLSSLKVNLFGSWQTRGKVSMGFLDSRHVLIVFDCNEDVVNALISPLRKVGESFFRLFRWTPDFSRKKESSTTTAWIRLPKLHPALLFAGYAKDIASSIGNFLCEEVLPASSKLFESPRVCLEVDLAMSLPSHIWIDSKVSYWQKIIYEGKLSYCSICSLHGHTSEECTRKNKKKRKKISSKPPPVRVSPDTCPFASSVDPSGVTNAAPTSSSPNDWTEVVKKKHRRSKKRKAGTVKVDPNAASSNAPNAVFSKLTPTSPVIAVDKHIGASPIEDVVVLSDTSPPIHEVFGKVNVLSKKEISYRSGIRLKESTCSSQPVRILKKPALPPMKPVLPSSPKGYTTEEWDEQSSEDEEEEEKYNSLGLPWLPPKTTVIPKEASTSSHTSS